MAASPDPGRPEEVHDAVAHASLRLLAGAVPKATLERLRRDAKAAGAEYPWEAATRALLADPVEPGPSSSFRRQIKPSADSAAAFTSAIWSTKVAIPGDSRGNRRRAMFSWARGTSPFWPDTH